ncbi:hypothetical protein HYW46_02895 [Candidatus Daviesbacteria bacterium]|nr:hypothetical protein [Candidatus Daviesbacteria bacterium]
MYLLSDELPHANWEEEVKSKIIDIQKPGLIVHGTFVENLTGIFSTGLTPESEQAVAGYLGTSGGKAATRRDAGDYIYIEETQENAFAGKGLTWRGLYDTYLLIDSTVTPHLVKDHPLIPLGHKRANMVPLSSIQGVVLDKVVGELYQRELEGKFGGSNYARSLGDTTIRNIPLKSTGERGTINDIMTTVYGKVLSFEELVQMAKDNMLAATTKSPTARVPIYDNTGKVLWPNVLPTIKKL